MTGLAAEAGAAGEVARILRVVHPDLFGRARAKQVPASAAERYADGVAYSKVHLIETLDGIPLEGIGLAADFGHPDLHAVPDPSTAMRPAWEPDAVWQLCDLVEHDGPSALCSRTILRRAVDALAALGYETIAAPEPELYLLHPSGEPYSPEGMSYAVGLHVDVDGAFGRIHRALLELDIGVGPANREFSPGQFEINVDHCAALTAADRLFVLKLATKELATLEGLVASFMALPFTGQAGNSLHAHVSLWRDGVNAFAGDRDGLSELCEQFLAGVLAHAGAIAAFAAPTVNSYKRLRPGGLAPATADWGHDHRLRYVRIPPERDGASRIEIRGGDASANPYLYLAAVLHAGRDGIARSLPAPPEGEGEPLPRTLTEALDRLEQDGWLCEQLGAELVQTYVALKRAEADAFDSAVTDWERRYYTHHV